MNKSSKKYQKSNPLENAFFLVIVTRMKVRLFLKNYGTTNSAVNQK